MAKGNPENSILGKQEDSPLLRREGKRIARKGKAAKTEAVIVPQEQWVQNREDERFQHIENVIGPQKENMGHEAAQQPAEQAEIERLKNLISKELEEHAKTLERNNKEGIGAVVEGFTAEQEGEEPIQLSALEKIKKSGIMKKLPEIVLNEEGSPGKLMDALEKSKVPAAAGWGIKKGWAAARTPLLLTSFIAGELMGTVWDIIKEESKIIWGTLRRKSAPGFFEMVGTMWRKHFPKKER